MDLMHNRHKLEQEREQAQEYRKKFYSHGQGGFQGAGGGSFSNAGDGHGYGVPSYTPSSYTAPASSGPQPAGDGVSRVYTPYNPSEDPVLKVPTSGALKWGAGGPAESSGASGLVSSATSGQGGSTYNITNNNNINYNYGSNITAISSDGNGSVPTFHDLEKAKKERDAKGGASYASSALGYLGSSIGSAASGLSGSKGLSGVGGGLSSITHSVQTSKNLATVSEAIKRNTGLDIHRALGGKTAVQLAEERLKKEQEQAAGAGGGYGGYQGISIPLTPAMGSAGQADAGASGSGGYAAPSEKLTAGKASKYGQQWGPTTEEEQPAKLVQTQKLFQGVEPRQRRMDDDSDEEDDKPK